MSLAFVFPGQGAFRPDCLAPWLEHPVASVLDEISAHLGRDVTALAADPGTGARTVDAQPAILAASVVAWRAVTDAGLRPDLVAGHSLGEVSATVAAGALDIAAATRLVDVRSRSMGRACQQRPGTMAAVVRLERARVDELVASVEGVVVANDNAPGQVVVAGSEEALARVGALAREAGGRALPIEVEGAFHSPAMASAAPEVAAVVDEADVRDPDVGLVSGVDAAPLTSAQQVSDALARGVLAPVRWREVQLALQAHGVSTLIELGPGGVLAGMARRTVADLEVLSVATPQQADEAVEHLALHTS